MNKRSSYVNYCPGDAIGSPACLHRDEAERYLEQDRQYLDLMKRVGVTVSQYPHINGYCDRCKPE